MILIDVFYDLPVLTLTCLYKMRLPKNHNQFKNLVITTLAQLVPLVDLAWGLLYAFWVFHR